MLKISHANLTFISGLIWFAVGVFLLQLGLTLLADPVQATKDGYYPILNFFQSFVGGVQGAVIVLIAICLYIGFLKGKYVLGKSAKKGVERICSFPNPTGLQNIYRAKYYILLGGMIALGMSIKYLGLPNDVRGAVDVIIGAALINGAALYFRMGLNLRKACSR
jgi:hypothetical protein